MEEIVWSIEWEKKLGTIENVHPTKRSDLIMPQGYAKSDCQYCGHEMKDGETVLLTMTTHPDHVFNNFKDTHISSNFVRVELMHPMCLAEKALFMVRKDNLKKEYIANV
jgi:hypothetical protein